MTLILLTNDDGISSPGLAALRRALEPLGEVVTIAPGGNRSAVARSITIGRTLEARRITFGGAFQGWALDGTPVDCVRVGLLERLCGRPDIVVAGVNLGPNMGEDVTYSGTVGAALEAALLGLPGVAVSIMGRRPRHLDDVVSLVVPLVARVLETRLTPPLALNVNLPDLPVAGVTGIEVARLGHAVYEDRFIVELDDGESFRYHVVSELTHGDDVEGTDFAAVARGRIALTPLRSDWRDESVAAALREWGAETAPATARSDL